MNVFDKYTKTVSCFNKASSALKDAYDSMRVIREMNDRLHTLLGNVIPQDQIAEIKDEDMPDVTVSDEKFAHELLNATEAKTMQERLILLTKIVKKVNANLADFRRKEQKLTSGMQKVDQNSSEHSVYVRKRMVVRETILIMEKRLKFVVRKFLEIRKNHINRIIGLSILFFDAAEGLNIGEIIKQKSISGVCDELEKLDKKYITK